MSGDGRWEISWKEVSLGPWKVEGGAFEVCEGVGDLTNVDEIEIVGDCRGIELCWEEEEGWLATDGLSTRSLKEELRGSGGAGKKCCEFKGLDKGCWDKGTLAERNSGRGVGW